MASTRLPGKPLADIGGTPMIVHVLRRAEAADTGPVVVATDSEAIFACVEKAGGRAVMTRADHVSGSDRIDEALTSADPEGRCGIVLNVQGDLPTIDAADIRAALAPLADPAVDIATLAAEIVRADERTNPNVVKVVGSPVSPQRLRALYFTRATAPAGDGPLYHHIGLYAYRRAALKRFVTLPPSPLELREKLEQLRALEAGMRIDVAIVNGVPLGVDTEEDLERARELTVAKPLTGNRQASTGTHDQSEESRIPGRAGGEFAPRDPRSLSEGGGDALRDVRGRVRGDRIGRGRSRHDPDRELGRGPRRRHPPPDAGVGAAYRRRALHAGAPPVARGERRDPRRHQDGREPRACARAMPQGDPPARHQADRRRRHRGIGA